MVSQTVIYAGLVFVVFAALYFLNKTGCFGHKFSGDFDLKITPTSQPPPQQQPVEHYRSGARPQLPSRTMRRNDPSEGMANGATQARREKDAALMDARRFDPADLFPDKNEMDDDWKEMFSHAENTLAQENFIEPSYEYSLGAINIPKRYLTHDLRGMPPVTTYDNMTPFNNSPFAGLDINETTTRRAGDL